MCIYRLLHEPTLLMHESAFSTVNSVTALTSRFSLRIIVNTNFVVFWEEFLKSRKCCQP